MDGKAEGLAGVMGGEESGVTARTTRLVLESAYFHPGRHPAHRPRTRAEQRRQLPVRARGGTRRGVVAASRRAEDLLLEICGGTSRGVTQSHLLPGQTELAPVVPDCVWSVARRCSGWTILPERVDEILTRFGLEKTDEDSSDHATEWRVPSYRPDLRREIDLIEEVARVYGLDQVPGRAQGTFSPASSGRRGIRFPDEPAPSTGRDGLHGNPQRFAGARGNRRAGGVPLKNPLGEESARLRGTLLPGLLASAGRNVRSGSADLRLFEIGRVFSPAIPLGQPEPLALGVVMTGAALAGVLAAWQRRADARPARSERRARTARWRTRRLNCVRSRPVRIAPDGGNLALLADVLIGGEIAGEIGSTWRPRGPRRWNCAATCWCWKCRCPRCKSSPEPGGSSCR